MLLDNPADLKETAAGKRLIGLDPGTKTIGVAVSDSRHGIATPLEVIRRKKLKDDLAALKGIIGEYDVGGIVIGLPVNMNGTEGKRCQSDTSCLRFRLPVAAQRLDRRHIGAVVMGHGGDQRLGGGHVAGGDLRKPADRFLAYRPVLPVVHVPIGCVRAGCR